MKPTPPTTLLIGCIVYCLFVGGRPGRGAENSGSTGAVARQAGSITGQVSNAATKSYLEGATVEVMGTGRATSTDREGRFQLNDVPAGAATLVVNFTGLDAQQIPVSVVAGERAVRDVELTSDIYKLDKFVVAGEREGTARAETLQRLAPNVKAVVSSDTFGNVADGNIGNFLQNIAGITAVFSGPDVRAVSIRGVNAAFNSVTMDGQQVATAQSAGVGRQFEFDQASLGNIETIEVTKAPTPDMNGASIGGSVNLVTKSAFDRAPGRIITWGTGFTTTPGYMGPAGRWKQPIPGYGPSANFSYQNVVGEKRNIGITLTALLHSQNVGGYALQQQFERRPDPGPVYNYSVRRAMVNGATRSRIATGLKLDYRQSEHTIVSLNMSYNYFHENNDNLVTLLQTVGVATAAIPQVLATLDASGNRTGGGFINPNYANGVTRVYPGGPSIANGGNSMTMTTYDNSGRTYLFSPQVSHKFDDLSVIYSLSYSSSASWFDYSHKDDKYDSRPKGEVTYNLPNIGWIVDASQSIISPLITQTQGPNLYDLKNYGSLLLNQTDRRGYDSVIGAKFDLKRDFRVARPTYIKTGFTYQRQHRHLWQNPRRYNYTGPDGILGTTDDNVSLEQFAYPTHRITADEERYFKDAGGNTPPWMNAYGVARHQALYPELWKEDIAFTSGRLTSDQLLTEQIVAAYVMGNVKFGPLSVLAGVRVEDTRDEGEGALTRLTPAEAARRAAWVGPVTDAEQRRRNLAQFGQRATNKGQYRLYLPGVHLKYQPFGGLVTRLSWSTGLGRPPFGNIFPNTNVNDTAQTVSVSNPNLKPQYSNSWDLSAEYYFKPQGMLSVSAFQKKIRDYIATDTSQIVGSGQDNGFDGQYVGYRISTSTNNGDAVIKGVEASYQQQLVFLPGWAKGLGIYSNVTKLWTHGNNPSFSTGPTGNKAIAGFLDVTANVGLGYRGHGLDLRLQAIYRGEYLVSNSTNPALVIYQVPRTIWTWKSRYNFSKNMGVFFDMENLLSGPVDNQYSAYRDRITAWRKIHAKIVAGINGRF